jgi:hypothetical protein
MSPQLTPEQHEAVTARSGCVVYFVDAQTQQQYAVIPAETFQRVQAFCDPEEICKASDTYALADEAWKPILADTALDVYAEGVSSPA